MKGWMDGRTDSGQWTNHREGARRGVREGTGRAGGGEEGGREVSERTPDTDLSRDDGYSRSQAGDGRGGIAMAAMTPLCRFRAIRHVINYDGDVGAGSLVSHYTGISGD